LPEGWASRKSTISTSFAVGDVVVHVTRSYDGGKISVKFNFHHPITSNENAIQALSGQGQYASLYQNYVTARLLVSEAYGVIQDE
jgi:hypothetical protein